MNDLTSFDTGPILITADQFNDWLKTAMKGDRCIYHFGFLARDRMKSGVLDDIADEAWRASNGVLKAIPDNKSNRLPPLGLGKVALAQKRWGVGKYEYIAERI